ncbi:MAG: hypothetical protein KDF54_04735, partial [Hydrogenophaga sp.]|nr:hypothetical protein [Hydrogenophaga sp.]
PVASLEAGGEASAVHSPGSVSVTALPGDLLDVLLCNNYAHHVSRWLLDARAGVVPLASTRLLAEGLRIPDGVAQSRDARWIAVSNHDDHSVYVYDSRDEPGEKSRPNAVLRGLNYPHGLRWTADAQFLLVADAGLPFVHVYERRTSRWEGEYLPAVSLKVLDDDRFMKGHYDPQEGGPKGLDLTSDHQTLVTTTLELPLAFFDLGPMLGTRPERDPQVDIFGSRLAGPVRLMADRIRDADARLLDQQRQLKEMQEAHALAMSEAQQRLADRMNDIKALRQTVERQQQHIVEVSRSYSWRVTAPYRALRRGMSALATRWSGKRALTP